MPGFQEDYLKNTIIPFAQKIASTDFSAFGGERVAGLTDLQKDALSGYGGLDVGSEAYDSAGNVFSGIANRTPEEEAAIVSQYQDQYTSGVIDPTLAAMARQREKDVVAEQGTITNSGAFGNTRRDIYQGERAGEYDARKLQTLALLNQKGLEYGTGRLSSGDISRSSAATSLASNAGSRLTSEMAGLGSQLTAGETLRGLSQAELDAEYEKYMLEMQYPLTQLTALTGGASAIPTGYGTTTEDAGLGGTLTALGSFGQGVGAVAGACWVAREVYGVEDPKWTEFREWLLTKSPSWFRDAYLKYGERAAVVVKRLPFLKAIIRPFMDAKRKSLGYK